MRALNRGRAPNRKSYGPSQRSQVRHVRLLRDPDRLESGVSTHPEGTIRTVSPSTVTSSIPGFLDVQRDIQRARRALRRGSRRTAVRVAGELSWDLEPSRSNFLPNSVPSWPPFRETTPSSSASQGVRAGHPFEHRRQGAGRDAAPFRADFDLVVTAQQVRSYKPDPAHFKECARRIEGTKKNWVHIASGYPTDVEPCLKSRIP